MAVETEQHIGLRWGQIADTPALSKAPFQHAERGAQFRSQMGDVGARRHTGRYSIYENNCEVTFILSRGVSRNGSGVIGSGDQLSRRWQAGPGSPGYATRWVIGAMQPTPDGPTPSTV